MRFLCLHGRGLSGPIFDMQTAEMRSELDEHEFVFIDGSIVTEPGDDTAAAVSDWHYGFVPWGITAERCGEFVGGLVEYVRIRGPFDGVMGFCEGGVVAATLLLEDQLRPFAGFRCGIFFSGAPPLDVDAARSRAAIRCLNPIRDGVPIRVPTAHIIEEDPSDYLELLRTRSPLAGLWEGSDLGQLQSQLALLCDETSREVFCHALGHAVPGVRSPRAVMDGAVRAIERTIQRGEDIETAGMFGSAVAGTGVAWESQPIKMNEAQRIATALW